MSEFHASIAIESLNLLDDLIENRNKIANLYKQRLFELPGISFQHVSENDVSTYKDFGVIIDAKNFGINRDKLINELEKESIYTKKYFFPPLHQMLAYKKYCKSSTNLHNTDYVSLNIICLPIYSHMNIDTVDKICFAIHRIWENVNNK
jgi:dTDP-4-amino-4,6-dideoxygalactose transaminase